MEKGQQDPGRRRWRRTYGSGVSGFFEDLSGRPDLLLLLAAFQGADLLLHPHAQTLHHLDAENVALTTRLL